MPANLKKIINSKFKLPTLAYNHSRDTQALSWFERTEAFAASMAKPNKRLLSVRETQLRVKLVHMDVSYVSYT